MSLLASAVFPFRQQASKSFWWMCKAHFKVESAHAVPRQALRHISASERARAGPPAPVAMRQSTAQGQAAARERRQRVKERPCDTAAERKAPIEKILLDDDSDNEQDANSEGSELARLVSVRCCPASNRSSFRLPTTTTMTTWRFSPQTTTMTMAETTVTKSVIDREKSRGRGDCFRSLQGTF